MYTKAANIINLLLICLFAPIVRLAPLPKDTPSYYTEYTARNSKWKLSV